MNKKNNKRMFDLKEVGFRNLDDQFVAITFDQKDFANALFNNAQSIDMDDFARSIYRNGKGEINDQVEMELLNVVPTLYSSYRIVAAIKETIEKSKEQ